MLFAFVGCAGVGKNTIIRDLLDAHRDEYDLLPTLTTRAMRPGESEGNPYCFVSEEEFKRQLDEGLIYEHQFIHKSYYGGSRLILEKKLQEGKALLKDIDILGANNLKTILKDTLPVRSIFLYVDSFDVLLSRLRGRGDAETDIQLRAKRFEMEMELSKTSDYMVNNLDREATGRSIDALIRAERAGEGFARAASCAEPTEEAVNQAAARIRAGETLEPVLLTFNGTELLITDGAERYLAAEREGAFVQKKITGLPDETLTRA